MPNSSARSNSPLPPQAAPWHSVSAEFALAELGADTATGLSTAEALERLRRYGPNCLASPPPRPNWLKFLDQFKSRLVMVLLAASVLAAGVGDFRDALVIAAVLLFNALLGYVQEHRAESALAALQSMLSATARVRRDGQVGTLASSQIVPGDTLLLEAGDRVAADARVIAAHAAEAAEATLTGESQPVAKSAAALPAATPLAERRNMVHMNTVITRGRLEAVVTSTGMQTQSGRLAQLLAQVGESATPLQTQLDRLGKRLAAIAAVVVLLIFALGIARGEDLLGTALTAIALAVAAIPEGLPAVVTVTLALGMQRMARRRAIVKRLAAVETLGCTTVICTDKTGTLTRNEMVVRRLHYCGRGFAVSGEGYSGEGQISADDAGPLPDLTPLLLPARACADARLAQGELIGDPTEGALLALATKGGIAAADRRIAEIPFDPAHQYMATFHADSTGKFVRMWVKGAPEALCARASRYLGSSDASAGATALPLDAAARAKFARQTEALAGQAMRVIAMAQRDIPAAAFAARPDLTLWAAELTLIGLIGIIDPPRAEAAAAIRRCQDAGIRVKMITGDHSLTATAIARQLGLAGEVREGHELDGADAAVLAELVERTAVFARASPEHKLCIVLALQRLGHVVAVTGDGVNDAPALRAADIGVAMGRTGSAVAKEAATMVLADDNFATIVGAVEEGRTIYDNIVKFVRFQLSTNIGAILTVLAAPLVGLPTPFTAIQILWVNIITDGPPALTLGAEPSRAAIMSSPPRSPAASILTAHRLLRLAWIGLIMASAILATYAWGEQRGGRPYATTIAFTTFVLLQVFNIFNARVEHGSAFNRQFFANGKLWLALAVVALLQVLAVHWSPAQAVFATVDISPQDWLAAMAAASSVLLLEELRKLVAAAWRRTAARRSGQ